MSRRRLAAAEWKHLIEAWANSGLSGQEFARRHDVHPSTLGWWRWKLRRDHRVDFAEVEVADPIGEIVIEVRDVRIHVPRGVDAGELRRVVDALC
jgi:transposase-like protein